jgi:hypothetical protein
MSYLTPLTKDVMDVFLQELKKKETKNIIMKNVVQPIMDKVFEQTYFYIVMYFLFHLLILILLIYIAIKVSQKP